MASGRTVLRHLLCPVLLAIAPEIFCLLKGSANFVRVAVLPLVRYSPKLVVVPGVMDLVPITPTNSTRFFE